MRHKVIGIGEILWDILPDGKVLGGAPANFAYHARQLGAEGIAISAIGDDESGLISFADFNLYQHPEDDGVVTDGSTSVQGYVEDKLLSSFSFDLDNGEAVVDKVTARLVAYNSTTGDFFDIQKEEYDFTIYPAVGGIQQINLDTTRAFKLASGSDFNKVDCSNRYETLA